MMSKRFLAAAGTAALALALQPALGAQLLKPVAASKAARAPAFLVSPSATAVDLDAVLEAGVGGTIDVTLPNGDTVQLTIEKIERHDNGDVTFKARVGDESRADLTALVTTGAAGTYAEIQTAHRTWGIIPSQQGHDWVFDKSVAESGMNTPKVDDARVPPNAIAAPRAKAVCPVTSSMPAGTVTIDVLAVITPDFVATHGGAAGAETRLNNLFANMNSYFTASNVAIQYRRVGTMNASFGPATNGDDDAALDAITANSGSFANVGAIRDFLGADMVAMFRGPTSSSGNSISGLAWMNGDQNGGIFSNAISHMYSVSGDWTFPGATLPAHELGHNLGNAHDRPNAGGSGGTATGYSYGHYVCGTGASGCGSSGFPDMGSGFGTIMAYERPTVAKFASPSLTCQSTRSGAVAAACGVADQQDDVRSMNCVRNAVRDLRPSWVGSCNLALDSDGDGIPDCIERAMGRSTTTKDNAVFTSNLLFAAQQYRDFLGREGDADGLNFWTSAMAGGGQTRLTMADTYFNSAEFQGSAAPIARLYFAYFLRIPDYGGLTHWIGQFRGGQTLNQVSQSFAQSAEFVGTYGNLNNNQFVSLVYQNVLGRAPDTAGLTYWVGQLATISRGAMMAQFSESPEYAALIRNKVYVTMMYSAMLRRAPDQGGFDFWVGQLNGGQTGQGLVNSFLNAAEYRGRFLP